MDDVTGGQRRSERPHRAGRDPGGLSGWVPGPRHGRCDGEVCATAFLHTACASVPVADPYAELGWLHNDLTTRGGRSGTSQLLIGGLGGVAEELRAAFRLV